MPSGGGNPLTLKGVMIRTNVTSQRKESKDANYDTSTKYATRHFSAPVSMVSFMCY